MMSSRCADRVGRGARGRATGANVELLEGRVVLSGSVAPSPVAGALLNDPGVVVARRVTPPATLVNVTVPPIDLNLLGLEVKTGPIGLSLTAQAAQGQPLGSAAATSLLGRQLAGLSASLDQALTGVVSLLNAASLGVAGVNSSGDLATAPAGTAQAITLNVPATHAGVLGVTFDVSPFTLNLVAHSGDGLLLGNALAAVANALNPPLPDQLDLNTLNNKLSTVLGQLNAAAPAIAPAPLAATAAAGQPVLNAAVPALNLNLLGLTLKTTPISIDAAAQSGAGALLGNVLTAVRNTQGAVPQQLTRCMAT